MNSRRTANRKVEGYAKTGKVVSQEECEDEYYSPQGGLSYEEDYTGNEFPPPTVNATNSTSATTRRRVPHRHLSSRQSSTEDYDYIPTGAGGYYDDYRHHSGGTVRAPITSTATTTTASTYSSPASLGRTNHLPKPPSSGHKHQLPPTPVRQLPHHSATETTTTTNATARRSNALLSRTSSAEYADQDSYSDSYTTYYNSSRGVAKNGGYNEDYNYAYRSNDNIATSQQDSVDESNEVIVHDKRTNDGRLSAASTRGYPQAPTAQRRNSSTQRQHSEEYYYNAEDVNDFVNEEDMGYYNDTPITRNDSRKKFLAGRGENSPLLQQNTDSLESRDDELRDSFETAVSSVTSSAQHRRGVHDYSTATETMTTTPADMTPTAGLMPATTTTSVPALIGNHVPPQTVQHRISAGLDNRDQEASSKTAANTATSVAPPVSSSPSAIVAATTLSTTASSITSTVNNTVLPPHSGYHSQTSVHSRGCLRTQDSLDSRAEEVSLHSAGIDYYSKSMNFRDSPPSVLMDRYGTDTPPLRGLNSLIEPYQPQSNKAPSVHASPSPPTMVQKQQSLDEQSHTSLVESPTASVDRQSSQGQAEKSKSVSFEDEEEVKPERRKMTVRERWHWAYNKIIMQLNVSRVSDFNN